MGETAAAEPLFLRGVRAAVLEAFLADRAGAFAPFTSAGRRDLPGSLGASEGAVAEPVTAAVLEVDLDFLATLFGINFIALPTLPQFASSF